MITPEEYAGVEIERRLHLRSFTGYSKKMMRKIRALQNELAFRKDFVLRQGANLENDPPAKAIREEIVKLPKCQIEKIMVFGWKSPDFNACGIV